MNWRAVIVVVVLGVVIAWAIRFVQGWPEAEFTAEEKMMLEGLAPILDTLVLQEEDLSSLSGYYETCEGGEAFEMHYGYRDEEGSADVERVRLTEASTSRPSAASIFCDFETGAYVSSIVDLPDHKTHLLALKRIDLDLARGQQADLERLEEATSLVLLPEEEPVDSRWVSAPTLGHTRYAWVRTVHNLDTGEQFEIYHFDFNRGVVMAGLLVKLPTSPTAETEALFIASTFDNKIAANCSC